LRNPRNKFSSAKRRSGRNGSARPNYNGSSESAWSSNAARKGWLSNNAMSKNVSGGVSAMSNGKRKKAWHGSAAPVRSPKNNAKRRNKRHYSCGGVPKLNSNARASNFLSATVTDPGSA